MTRILTATVLIALLAGALLSPPWVFIAAIACVVLLAWNEFVRLARSLGCEPSLAPGGLAAIACALAFAAGDPGAPVWVLLLGVLLLTLAALRDHGTDPARLARSLAAAVAGVVWLGVLLGTQIGVRTLPDGQRWLLLLYGCVAIGDSAAYYGGSAFGRRALAATLSPNKTVAGALFGLTGSVLAAAVLSFLLPELGAWPAAALGLVLGAFGQVGDLVESSLKRAAGTKDSSNLLPGHGGVLDRIDAHLFAGAALWITLTAGWLP